MIEISLMTAIVAGAAAIGLGCIIALLIARARQTSTQNNVRNLLANARREAEAILKDGKLQAKEEVLKAREQSETEAARRRQELSSIEQRLNQREENLDRKSEAGERKEAAIDARLSDLEERRIKLEAREEEIQELRNRRMSELEKVGGLSAAEAKSELLHELEEELNTESGLLIRRIHQEAHENAEKDARKIISLAIERYAAEQVNEMTTCTVSLPSDEMKGRIIGKEGRNIRALEAVTGVNILIDDTPEVVVISGFDPLRREIAKRTLERLIEDGRIHPSRIEEVVTKVRSEIDSLIESAGKEAVYDLKLQHLEPEVVAMVGRLKFRHSYGQNVLKHSIEMGHLMGMIASELGLDPAVARRVGLLHDIGKAMDHDMEGSHAVIGADFLKRHGEDETVCNAVAAHHNEVEALSLYAILARAGDAMTAARPGARSETTEIYLKRLEKLEQIANGYRGVEKCYAVHAGREIRVFVQPSEINDDEAMQLARNISRQVQSDLQYPGQIKVTVVRETRCIEYAK